MTDYATMKRNLPLGWLMIVCACGDPVPVVLDIPALDTETDGIYTSGIVEGEGGDADDGADETAAGPTFCLSDATPGVEAVKHMCDITYDLDIEFTPALHNLRS